MGEFGVMKGSNGRELILTWSHNDRLEYMAVIRDIPPNLLRPMIQQLAGIAPYV